MSNPYKPRCCDIIPFFLSSVDAPKEIESLYWNIRNVFKIARKSSVLQNQIGIACAEMETLYFPPLSREINDNILTAILAGTCMGSE